MIETTPEVYLISRPSIDWVEVTRYLSSVSGLEWSDRLQESGISDGERLIEFMGRMCYRSWAPGLNPNVTRIRADTAKYLDNILASAHGSVLEHANYTFVFQNVSRVFTHELVRHRAGVAISQESLRFVRLADIPFEHPPAIKSNPELLEAANQLLKQMESFQSLVASSTELGQSGTDFHTKKTITSAARRYAPDGVATTIGWTANVRALRHVVAARTASGAEEEIRRVFDKVAQLLIAEMPLLFADFERSADGTWAPGYPKV
jgi:thymidylate synthase (FAD)